MIMLPEIDPISQTTQFNRVVSCLSEFIFGLFNCNSCWCMDYVSSHFHLRRLCILINGLRREVWRKFFLDKVRGETISRNWDPHPIQWILWLEKLCLNFDDVQTENWTNFPILVAISGVFACYVMCYVVLCSLF